MPRHILKVMLLPLLVDEGKLSVHDFTSNGIEANVWLRVDEDANILRCVRAFRWNINSWS